LSNVYEVIVKYCWVIKDQKLTDPNIWIADTGATVHSTANMASANNWEPDTSKTVVVMDNGKNEKVTKIGKVKGIAKDKDEINQGNIVLLDVMILPNGKYNLISVTKLRKNRWKLEGNSNNIKLKKDDKKIVFNRKMNTSRGVLFFVRIHNKNNMIAETKDQGNTITATKKSISMMPISFLANHLRK
jgi:hypothetical protein